MGNKRTLLDEGNMRTVLDVGNEQMWEVNATLWVVGNKRTVLDVDITEPFWMWEISERS